METKVYNMEVSYFKEEKVFSCSPREAVIVAHAQSKGDFNTWGYEEKYGPLVKEGLVSVACGNYSAWLEEDHSIL